MLIVWLNILQFIAMNVINKIDLRTNKMSQMFHKNILFHLKRYFK